MYSIYNDSIKTRYIFYSRKIRYVFIVKDYESSPCVLYENKFYFYSKRSWKYSLCFLIKPKFMFGVVGWSWTVTLPGRTWSGTGPPTSFKLLCPSSWCRQCQCHGFSRQGNIIWICVCSCTVIVIWLTCAFTSYVFILIYEMLVQYRLSWNNFQEKGHY